MASRHMRNADEPSRQHAEAPRAGEQEAIGFVSSVAPSRVQQNAARAGVTPSAQRGDGRPRGDGGEPRGEGDRHARKGDGPKDARKKRSPSQILSTVLIVVGVALLLVAGGMWGFAQYRYWKQDQITTSLQKTAIVQEPTAEKPYPDIDWEALKAVNSDVCGWIYVPDSVINYPVYQGVDNDQYLRTTATGEWSVGGQLFLDYENTNPGMLDHQTIIYGHHMLDGTLFQPIAWLEDQEKFDQMDTIWYITEQYAYELEPLLLYYTVPTDTEVRRFRFNSNEEFRAYLNQLLAKAVSKRSDAAQIIAGAKHVLTLSTCNYYDEWGRTIFLAIPKSEAKAALDGTTAAEEAKAVSEAFAQQQAEQAAQQEQQEQQGEGEQPAGGEGAPVEEGAGEATE